jgi:hypothetical protein
MGKKDSPREKTQNRAGATPVFGLQPPKKFVGPLPPCGTVNRAGFFSTVIESRKKHRSTEEEQHTNR